MMLVSTQSEKVSDLWTLSIWAVSELLISMLEKNSTGFF